MITYTRLTHTNRERDIQGSLVGKKGDYIVRGGEGKLLGHVHNAMYTCMMLQNVTFKEF